MNLVPRFFFFFDYVTARDQPSLSPIIHSKLADTIVMVREESKVV